MSDAEELERGRECYAKGAWTDAYESFVRADRMAPLGPEDLRKATSQVGLHARPRR